MSTEIKHIFIIEAVNYNKSNLDSLITNLKEENSIDYMIYMRNYPGKEKDIVRKCCTFFRKEKLRFYACGNFDMIDGIIKGLDGITNREIAFSPIDRSNMAFKKLTHNFILLKLNEYIEDKINCVEKM